LNLFQNKRKNTKRKKPGESKKRFFERENDYTCLEIMIPPNLTRLETRAKESTGEASIWEKKNNKFKKKNLYTKWKRDILIEGRSKSKYMKKIWIVEPAYQIRGINGVVRAELSEGEPFWKHGWTIVSWL